MVLPGRGPMRVVYDKAVVHESYSVRARLLQRAARLVFKPLMHLTPLNDRSLATIRALDKLSARRPRSPYVESIRSSWRTASRSSRLSATSATTMSGSSRPGMR